MSDPNDKQKCGYTGCGGTAVKRGEDGSRKLIGEPCEGCPDCAPRADGSAAEVKPCTCHPDDNPPVPCARRYALSECRKAAEVRRIRDEHAGDVARAKTGKWNLTRAAQDIGALLSVIDAVVAERDEARSGLCRVDTVLSRNGRLSVTEDGGLDAAIRNTVRSVSALVSRVAELERVLKEARIVVRHAGDGPTTNALVARIDAALSKGSQP